MKQVFTILVLVLLTCPLAVQACSCAPPSAKEAYDDADVVFAGKVTKVTYVDSARGNCDEPRIIVHFQVRVYWKGKVHSRMTLHTVENRCSCDGYDFIQGETYLIYADEAAAARWLTKDGVQLLLPADEHLDPKSKILGTSWCSRTGSLLQHLGDLATFGKPKEPQK